MISLFVSSSIVKTRERAVPFGRSLTARFKSVDVDMFFKLRRPFQLRDGGAMTDP